MLWFTLLLIPLAIVVHRNRKRRNTVFLHISLNLHRTKAFGQRYVISKTEVKRNLLVVIDYFKNVHLELFRENKKGVLRNVKILF